MLICNNFEKIYNSVVDERSKSLFYEQLAHNTDTNSCFVICLRELSDCIKKQTRGSVVGLVGIARVRCMYVVVPSYLSICVKKLQ